MAETKPLTTAYAPGARSLPPPAHSTPHSAHEPTHRSTIRSPQRGDNPQNRDTSGVGAEPIPCAWG